MKGLVTVTLINGQTTSYGVCSNITTTATSLNFDVAGSLPTSIPKGSIQSFTITPYAPGDEDDAC